MRGSTSSKFLVVETKSISHSRAPSMDSLVSVVDSVIERGPYVYPTLTTCQKPPYSTAGY